jgi:ABC-2 type transport system permease protein
MSIGIIGATNPPKKEIAALTPIDYSLTSIFALLLGKIVTYFMVSGLVSTLALTLPYYLFGYPMLGSVWAVVAVIVPYILACTMLGIALSTLFSHREEPIMWLLWSSIPVLMLSGVSYPTSAMPEPLAYLGALFPSSHAVKAFLRVRDMGATVSDVVLPISALWIQVILYGILAALLLGRRVKKREVVHIYRTT